MRLLKYIITPNYQKEQLRATETGSSFKYDLCPLPANFTWNLFSGLRICTYRGQFGAKSLTAQARRIVWWS